MDDKDLLQKTVNWVHNAFDQVATGILALANRADKNIPVIDLIGHSGKPIAVPAWATMFQPRDQEEARLIREYAPRIAKETGFLVYDGAYGVWLGINEPDGEFFVSHWLPLFVTLTKIYEEKG